MDDFYPRQVMDCCDVVLLKQFHVDIFDPNAVRARLDDTNRDLQSFAGKLLPSGTCFIISKAIKDIRIKGRKVIALAATNFHAAYILETRQKNSKMYAVFDEERK